MKPNQYQDTGDVEELRRALEQATAAESTAEKEADPQTAGLREAWLALGQLLSAAEPPADWSSAPLVARPARRLRAWAAALCAVAASLLIGVAIYGLLGPKAGPVGPVPSPDTMAAAQQTPTEKIAVAPPKQKSAAPADDPTAWDDGMDKQFAAAGQNLISVEQSWSQTSDAADMVRYELQQMEQDVKENEL